MRKTYIVDGMILETDGMITAIEKIASDEVKISSPLVVNPEKIETVRRVIFEEITPPKKIELFNVKSLIEILQKVKDSTTEIGFAFNKEQDHYSLVIMEKNRCQVVMWMTKINDDTSLEKFNPWVEVTE